MSQTSNHKSPNGLHSSTVYMLRTTTFVHIIYVDSAMFLSVSTTSYVEVCWYHHSIRLEYNNSDNAPSVLDEPIPQDPCSPTADLYI